MMRIVAPALMSLALAPSAVLSQESREVGIRWEVGAEQPLTITVTEAEGATDVVDGLSAYAFELRRDDRVVITLAWPADEADQGVINYSVAGTDVNAAALDAVKKLVTTSAPGNAELLNDPRTRLSTEIRSVTDPLVAGGTLTATFVLKGTEGSGNDEAEVTRYTSNPLAFRVRAERPRVTVSNGMAFSGAPDPSVAIVKSSTILTFDKDGQTQQAFEQRVAVQDHSPSLQPVQALVTFVNLHLAGGVYASVGLQVDSKIFEEPMLGLSYRLPLPGSAGVHLAGGIHLSEETRILPGSGFFDGMALDPTVGLTVEDIPTEEIHRRQWFFSLTFDFGG